MSAGYALGVSATLAVLAGCSSGGAQMAPLAANRQIVESSLNARSVGHVPTLATEKGIVAAHPDHGRSWMDPDAKTSDLLYVSDEGADDVYVYSWPQGKLKGMLTGFDYPQGECVDKAGNVFIVNARLSEVLEYAHGGTSPIATLLDSGYYPLGCSVDPMTGNLAVANVQSTGSGPGNIAIYAHASGTPTTYADPGLSYMYFCGYDNKGNLFIDGENAGSIFAFAKLSGSKKFTNITLNQTIGFAGGVQWDGTHVAVGDVNTGIIYQFTIKRKKGTEVGSTPLNGSDRIFQFFIRGKMLVGPNTNSANVMFWNYPSGGTATKTISGLNQPIGSAVSSSN
jgi:hypothetical protein